MYLVTENLHLQVVRVGHELHDEDRRSRYLGLHMTERHFELVAVGDLANTFATDSFRSLGCTNARERERERER